MRDKLKKLLGLTPARPVFIIGTGRSGTHWLANTFRDHPEIDLTVEMQPMFGLAQQIALNPSLAAQRFPELIASYQQLCRRSSKSLYIDKSHPNIWIADNLKRAFPDALFLGIERNPYATVSSMMRHKGVLSWHQRWREFPIPNRFLGITARNADDYATKPLAAQCALRWTAHKNQMTELESSLGSQLLVISYENFQENTQDTVNQLTEFLGLSKPLTVPHVKSGSLESWRNHLRPADVQDIRHIVHFSPEGLCDHCGTSVRSCHCLKPI